MTWIRNKSVIGTHKSVMVTELIENFQQSKKSVFVDCTFGAGGHSKAIRNSFPNVLIVGFDRDPITKNYLNICEPFVFENICFSDFLSVLFPVLNEKKKELSDCFVFADLGMSNLQLFDSSRGFSYQNLESQLNLSMGINSRPVLELLNNKSSDEIFTVFRDLSEEKYSNNLTSNILKNRPIMTVEDIVKIVKISVPYRGLFLDKCLSRIFQGLRIYSNNEIDELEKLLYSMTIMKNSVISIISFHSIEDRIVKSWMKENSKSNILQFPQFKEKKINVQSRSAKMRTGIVN